MDDDDDDDDDASVAVDRCATRPKAACLLIASRINRFPLPLLLPVAPLLSKFRMEVDCCPLLC
jgi:hypothetical protein